MRPDPLEILRDRRVLLEAHAASSAYVMRRVFESSRELTVFSKRADLAPEIAGKIEKALEGRFDPVFLSAHLFALEMTGVRAQIVRATGRILRDKRALEDPLLGQFAGQIGSRIIGLKKPSESHLTFEELKKVSQSLGQKGGRQ